MPNTYFTSDLHFGHSNILKYRKPPPEIDTLEKMENLLISNYKSVVKPEDTVYILGDISFYGDMEKNKELVRQLPGQKYAIWGNHDRKLRKNEDFCSLFVNCADLLEIKVQDPDFKKGQRIVLCHYAMKIWDKAHYHSWHLFGHSHGNMADDPNSRSLDVGVDAWNLMPVSYEQIKERMKLKTFVPIDHHNKDTY